MKILGIKNCDKVRKTLKWCKDNNIEFKYHDFRQDGFDQKTLDEILEHFQIEELFNKRSTTWRSLSDSHKKNLNKNLLLENPTLIPRPIVISEHNATLGFKPEHWIDV